MEDKYYYVSVEDTKKYGIIKAAIIGRVRWWCDYNKDKTVKDRFYNDEWWSGYISSKEFSEQLGMPIKTIEANLSKLLKSGVLLKDTFNRHKRDRTGWYRVNPNPPIEENHFLSKGKSISSLKGNAITTKGEMHLLSNGKALPDNHSVNPTLNQKTINPTVIPTVISENTVGLKQLQTEALLDGVNSLRITDKLKQDFEALLEGIATPKQKENLLDNIHQFEKTKVAKELILTFK